MRQVFQNLQDGTTEVVDVPAPKVRPGHVLIRTEATVISAGTERMLVEFGRANLVQKAMQQPDRVKQVIDKVTTDGLATTVHAVRSRLGEPLPLGYANAGRVLAVGEGVDDIAIGDRVASNGPHAEVVCVPRNLVGRCPSVEVSAEQAAFATIGAIALQSVRLLQPTLGERFVVTGLGLVGLLTVQLLRASGCQVLGIDFDPERLAIAARHGATTFQLTDGASPEAAAAAFSRGQGVDGVIIAAATDSNDPIRHAAHMCRKRGRVVLVGVAGLEIERADFYEKELSFQVSCSYGPGRYDPGYELAGNDYPLPFVRWTAARNMEAFLQVVADGSVTLDDLVTHRFPLDATADAYAALTGAKDALGIVLTYPQTEDDADITSNLIEVRPRKAERSRSQLTGGQPAVAVIGAGSYTRQTLLPALVATQAHLHTIVSAGGATAGQAARQHGFAHAGTDWRAVLDNDEIDAVFITTRHDTHAEMTIAALRAGKDVYCEKPLALTHAELDSVEATLAELGDDAPRLVVGFNRRHAPYTVQLRNALAHRSGPASIVITVNAGAIPADHWVHDPIQGGGRIVGEACHFIDLAIHLVGTNVTKTGAIFADTPTRDTAHLTLGFDDGSTAAINYLATGHPRFPKERIDVFAEGRVHTIDNWRRFSSTDRRTPPLLRPTAQEKGHAAAVEAFLRGAALDPGLVASRIAVSLALAEF